MVTSFISLKKIKWWNSNIYFWHIKYIDGNLRDGNLIRRCAEGHLLLRFSWLVKFSLRQRFSAKAALLTDLCTRTCFRICQQSLHKKWSFPLRISSVNVTKSAGNCGFGHIHWRNPECKTSFFVQWMSFSFFISAFFIFY